MILFCTQICNLQTDELQSSREQLSVFASEGARWESLLAASHHQHALITEAQQRVFLTQFRRHRQQVQRLRLLANQQRVTLLTTLRSERQQTAALIQRKDAVSQHHVAALQAQLSERSSECARLGEEVVMATRQADTERLVMEEQLDEVRREVDAMHQRLRREQKRCQAAEGVCINTLTTNGDSIWFVFSLLHLVDLL
jgi:hypothetical protein